MEAKENSQEGTKYEEQPRPTLLWRCCWSRAQSQGAGHTVANSQWWVVAKLLKPNPWVVLSHDTRSARNKSFLTSAERFEADVRKCSHQNNEECSAGQCNDYPRGQGVYAEMCQRIHLLYHQWRFVNHFPSHSLRLESILRVVQLFVLRKRGSTLTPLLPSSLRKVPTRETQDRQWWRHLVRYDFTRIWKLCGSSESLPCQVPWGNLLISMSGQSSDNRGNTDISQQKNQSYEGHFMEHTWVRSIMPAEDGVGDSQNLEDEDPNDFGPFIAYN